METNDELVLRVEHLELLLPEANTALELALAASGSAQDRVAPKVSFFLSYFEHLITVWAWEKATTTSVQFGHLISRK